MKITHLIAAGALALLVAAGAQAAGAPKGSHANLPCTQCHVNGDMTVRPAMTTCLGCHGSYAALAERTAKLNPAFNPHLSHKGLENCTSCHGMHGEGQFICNDCHTFKGSGTVMK